MSSALWNIVLVAQYVVFMPLTHVVFPIVIFWWNVLKHTLIIPILLMIRTTLFGLVYLPLTPVLSAVRVKYDTDVPVEVSLFRLTVDLWPHVKFFLVNLLHYVMISMFVGIMVGFVAGFNVSIVSRFVALPEKKVTASKNTQTTPYVNALRERIAKAAEEQTTNTRPKEEPIFDKAKISQAKINEPALSNEPVVKKEEVLPFIRKPFVSSSNERDVYEDDDGYSYMTYESPEPEERLLPLDAVHTIEEESEEEDAFHPQYFPGSLLAPTATLNSTWTGSTFTTNVDTGLLETTSDTDESHDGKGITRRDNLGPT